MGAEADSVEQRPPGTGQGLDGRRGPHGPDQRAVLGRAARPDGRHDTHKPRGNHSLPLKPAKVMSAGSLPTAWRLQLTILYCMFVSC